MTSHNISQNYTIKEASKLTGLPASTLRYYESIGIIKPVDRGLTSKQREYSQADLNVLDTIACLNATGMALENMRVYIANAIDPNEHVDDQIRLLANQHERLLADERHIKLRMQYIELKIEYWKALKQRNESKVKIISAQAKKLASELKKV